MDFLGIGPLELMLILVIALIVLGPNDMVKAGRTIGRFMRKVATSSTWQEVRKIRYLPNKLMREAGLEEHEWNIVKDLEKETNDISPWLTPPILDSPPAPIVKTPQRSENVTMAETPLQKSHIEQARQDSTPHRSQSTDTDAHP